VVGVYLRVNALRMAAKGSPLKSPMVIVASEVIKYVLEKGGMVDVRDVFWEVSLRVGKKELESWAG
jgi:hypothetical protein